MGGTTVETRPQIIHGSLFSQWGNMKRKKKVVGGFEEGRHREPRNCVSVVEVEEGEKFPCTPSNGEKGRSKGGSKFHAGERLKGKKTGFLSRSRSKVGGRISYILYSKENRQARKTNTN